MTGMCDQDSGMLGDTIGTAHNIGPEEALGLEPKYHGRDPVTVCQVGTRPERVHFNFPTGTRNQTGNDGCIWTPEQTQALLSVFRAVSTSFSPFHG